MTSYSLVSSLNTSRSVMMHCIIAEFKLCFSLMGTSQSVLKTSFSEIFWKILVKISTRECNFCNVVNLNPEALLKVAYNRGYFQQNFPKFFEQIFRRSPKQATSMIPRKYQEFSPTKVFIKALQSLVRYFYDQKNKELSSNFAANIR